MTPKPPTPDRIDDEIAFHIEQQVAKNLRAGMSPQEACRAALLKFGALESAREGARDEVRGAWLRDLVRDLRLSFRSLGRMPSFAAATILTLGLGLGAAVAMYSVVNAVLLRPLPYPDPDRIVRLFQLNERGGRSNVSGPNFFDWRESTRSFSHLALVSNWWGRAPITGLGEPRRVPSMRVSREFFDVFGVAPERGRLFSEHEFASEVPTAAVIGADFAERVGADALGKTFVLDGYAIAVIGIMPREFDYPVGTDLWLPLSEAWAKTTSRTSGNFNAVARIAPGVDLATARSEISAVSRGLRARLGDGAVLFDAQALPILELMTLNTRDSLNMLLAGALLLLVVAVVNVSNMLVARAVQRRKEFAVQLALGAGTFRLTRQILAETLALCLCGSLVGVALAAVALRAFVAIGPPGTPRLETVAVDWMSVAAGLALAVTAAGILAWVTALGARSRAVASSLSDEGRSGSAGRRQTRLRQGLIVVEVSLTFVLVAGAGLLARSLATVLAIDPGFRTDSNALIVDITMGTQTDEEVVQRARRQSDIVARLAALPGVEHVGLIDSFPAGSGSFRNGTFVEMTRVDELTNANQIRALGTAVRPRQGTAGFRLTNGGYFKAMGIPLRRGRSLEDSDAPGAPHVAVISESLANAKWPGQDPIGRYIQFGNMDGDFTGMRVVGIVGDVRELSIERAPPSIVYASFTQRPRQAAACAIVVRGPEPARIADAVRRAIRDLAPDVPIELRTSDAVLDAATGTRRFNLWLIGAFGVVALLLAGVGVYGLVAFTVAQRRREMGIRLALGADAGAMVRLIVGAGLTLAVLGIAAGLGITLAVSTFIEALLFNVTASDPGVLAGAGAVMLAAAAAAAWLPARRVARISPTETLRSL